jgi:hypothetical protein
MYSYHQFLFPFRFDYLSKEVKDRHEFYKEVQFDSRVKERLEYLFDGLERNGWEYHPFKIENDTSYNEFVYFHDFVKDALFNLNESPKKNATSWFFEKKLKDKNVKIKVVKFNDEKIFNLQLSSISLRIFETGIGILSFEMENDKYYDFQDILDINEYFRRVYPPFVGRKFSLDEVMKKYMAKEIELNGVKYDIKEFENLKNISHPPISSLIIKILGDIFTQEAERVGKFLIQPVIDERMFVVCWYGNNGLANSLKNYFLREENYKLHPINDLWYRYLFVDAGDKSIQDEEMQINLLKKHTYTRWKNYGTFYGISRYSFVVLTQDLATLKKNYADFIVEHIRTVYYQMVVLTLTNRASILRFSDEVAAISDLDLESNLFERVTNLFQNYLRFKNKLYFKEVTSQEQGIELYSMMRDILNVDNDINDLNSELFQIDNFAQMKIEHSENKEVAKLTKVATYLMPPTLAAGIFGMNIFGESFAQPQWAILVIILVFGSFFGAKKIIGLIDYLDKQEKK